MPEITVFPPQLWIIYAVSLVCCFMGFFRFVWFMSVGYGLSAAGIGAAMLVMSILGGRFNIVFAIQCILFIIYGFRLGGFLLIRELKNTRYREKMREVEEMRRCLRSWHSLCGLCAALSMCFSHPVLCTAC